MANRRPVIGVPANVLVEKGGSFPGTERAYVNQDYLDALGAAGALPIVLPMAFEPEAIQAQLALLDGLLFSGGVDLDPLTYGEEPARGLGEVFPDLDRHQLALARTALGLGLPMLGICRGIQLLNVAFGGTLHQDLDSLPAPVLRHGQLGWRHAASHTVDLAEGSRLRSMFGQASIGTNSFHHQAIKDPAPGFRVSARTRDGVIEAVEAADGAFVMAVQWHPESMVERHPEMRILFQELVRACAGRI
jgi:putative glutamine amidotransferase